MAEIYKLKNGSGSLTLRYAGNLSDQSDYFAQAMTESSYIMTITGGHQAEWESAAMMPFPAPPHDFANAYDTNPGFVDFMDTYVIPGAFGRYPQNGDVITFENWDYVFVFSDSNIVWNIKKGNQHVYRVKKGEEVVFQRQYLRGYGNVSLSSRVSTTGTSIKWRVTNRDPDVAADTYANVTENEIPSLDFSSGYKRGIVTAQPLSNNEFTTSNLNDGSRYYCKAGLKHPTLMIMPIIQTGYLSYDLPIAAPSDEVIDVTENSVTIKFTNNSNTKTIEIFARVGTSAGATDPQGSIAPNSSKSVVFFRTIFWYNLQLIL